jgi:hypothetical protein
MLRALSDDRNRLWLTQTVAAFLFGALLGGQATRAQQPAEPIGFVDAVSGRWLGVQDGQPLARGQLVYSGQTVTIGQATSGFVRIRLFAGMQPWERVCTEREPCAGTYRPPSPADAARGFWAFLSSFWKPGQQLPPVLAGTRSVNDVGPEHAFVHASGGTVDLRPALGTVPAGRHTLWLSPAPGGSLDGEDAGRESPVDLDAGGPVPVALRPGLYVLTVADHTAQPVGHNVLVLVRDAADPRGLTTWIEARQQAARLENVAPATRAALLAHTLYALDAQPE